MSQIGGFFCLLPRTHPWLDPMDREPNTEEAEMNIRTRFSSPLALAAAMTLAGCADGALTAPIRPPAAAAPAAALAADHNATIAELRRATARYHNLAAAEADGFVPVITECEQREGEVAVAIPYVSLERLLDGALEPSLPDALLYEPSEKGTLTLVGVEMLVPYPLWTSPEPPRFLGVPLQREDEFGVFGIHVWIWRHNPAGMFAVENPRVSCGAAT